MLDDPRGTPWTRGAKARPNTRLFYQIVIGSIRMDEATALLLSAYGDTDLERVPPSGFSPIAILTIDQAGIAAAPEAVAISSFAWGLPYALRRELRTLASWPGIEPKLIAAADALVQRTDDDGQPIPVDEQAIARLFKHLVETLQLPSECVAPPSFALRIYQPWFATEPPEPPPMGSFFLGDLTKTKALIAAGALPDPIAHYLGMMQPAERVDILRDDLALADALAPSRIPECQWPSPKGKSLVTLQQAAINLATRADGRSRLHAVNGPPGTGKTTLLRDLVAAVLIGRARMMAELMEPSQAFEATGAKFKVGNGFVHHYKIDHRLRGFELVVASTNNKAVENVSAELPGIDAVDRSRESLRYFKLVADQVAEGRRSSESWGLIAAVLGNAKNRFAFRQAAWAHEDYGLRAYLLEASGNPQTVVITDPKTGRIVEQRKPRVVSVEKPPADTDAARRRWRRGCKRFKLAIKQVEERLTVLEAGRRALDPGPLHARRLSIAARLDQAELRSAKLRTDEAKHQEGERRLDAERSRLRQSLAEHERTRPAVLARLLRPGGTSAWEQRRSDISRELDRNARELESLQTALGSTRAQTAEANRDLTAAQKQLVDIDREIAGIRTAIERAFALAGARFVDAAFLEREPIDLHRDTPWLDDSTLALRATVFEAAMALHRAFIDAAAKPIRNNLDLLFRSFFGRSGWSTKMRPLMPDLWSTFFCVVPVISTTFAAVERMFGYLDPGALGWLLVDEAGQAAPQAVVGALLRVQRAVIVGDPFQLPPVTMLPTELAERIAGEFKVDEARFIAPQASVQALADGACMFGAAVGSKGSERRVGMPLLVHRRCAEPMFSLSNKLAYGGMMVHGRGAKPSSIRDLLGPSRWIDVKPGRCEDKWSEAEGQKVVELLRRLDAAGLKDLDLYVISPFRIVAQKLREILVAEEILGRWTMDPYGWVRERVGTVYTVQGREADTMMLVLGAAEPQRRGARAWAGQDVNQLNVAVTRAKENLYVIGHRFVWASAGEFAALERALP